MNRPSLVAAGVAGGLAAAVLLSTGGGAQTGGARTLVFLDATDHATQRFVDIAPKSPTRDGRDRRFRLSIGDTIYVRSPILERAGGKRIGTAYSQFSVVRGSRFATAVFRGHGVFNLRGGQIAADGVFRAAGTTNTVAVVGGTGAYEGAQGSLTFTEANGGSRDTVHLLP